MQRYLKLTHCFKCYSQTVSAPLPLEKLSRENIHLARWSFRKTVSQNSNLSNFYLSSNMGKQVKTPLICWSLIKSLFFLLLVRKIFGSIITVLKHLLCKAADYSRESGQSTCWGVSSQEYGVLLDTTGTATWYMSQTEWFTIAQITIQRWIFIGFLVSFQTKRNTYVQCKSLADPVVSKQKHLVCFINQHLGFCFTLPLDIQDL